MYLTRTSPTSTIFCPSPKERGPAYSVASDTVCILQSTFEAPVALSISYLHRKTELRHLRETCKKRICCTQVLPERGAGTRRRGWCRVPTPTSWMLNARAVTRSPPSSATRRRWYRVQAAL